MNLNINANLFLRLQRCANRVYFLWSKINEKFNLSFKNIEIDYSEEKGRPLAHKRLGFSSSEDADSNGALLKNFSLKTTPILQSPDSPYIFDFLFFLMLNRYTRERVLPQNEVILKLLEGLI
ncbi:hypothetical protein HHI36_012252 [Cryptolaemus montrouzieri]|uniref:Uncharacterized protein n=1 Tax=Cryptolaemus montrouzieri TaxID=559131 RepID=A0ABD2NF77_9CUCU